MRSMVEGYTGAASPNTPPPPFGWSPSPRASLAGRTTGFTLVELLIVLTIIGLASAAVVLAMPDPRGSLTAEAERFAARAAAARDLAIVDAEALSMRVTPIGYGFDRRANSEWRPLGGKPFADHTWPDGTRAVLESEGIARITFDPTGLVDPARITLVRDDERVVVEIDADGGIDVVT